jgi:hypothetical protein
MSYRAVRRLGQLGQLGRLGQLGAFDYEATAEKCATVASSSGDWDTKAGREEGTKAAANCAAEAACAYFTGGASTAAGGLCGEIGEIVVGWAIDIWNDLFGNEEEQQAERERLRQQAAWLASEAQVQTLDHIIASAYGESEARLQAFHDEILPSERGKWGKPCTSANKAAFYEQWGWSVPAEFALDWTCPLPAGQNNSPMSLALRNRGAFYRVNAGVLAYPWFESEYLAVKERLQRLGISLTSQEMKDFLTKARASAMAMLEQLKKAEAKVRADLIAQAAANAVRIKLMSASREDLRKLETRSQLRKAGGVVFVAAGVGAALWMLRSGR